MKSPYKWILLMNSGILIVALIMIFAGAGAKVTTHRIGSTLKTVSASDLDSRFSVKIGKPYTQGMHNKFVGLTEANDRVIENAISIIRSYSETMLQVAGLVTLLALWNLLLLHRFNKQYRALLVEKALWDHLQKPHDR